MSLFRSGIARGALGVLVAGALLGAACKPRLPLMWVPAPLGDHNTGRKDFDVNWTSKDHNGSPMNPTWGAQAQVPPRHPPTVPACARAPHSDTCTSQKPTRDEAGFPNRLICAFELTSPLHGHVNWTPASAFGKVLWMALATDGDYNLKFFPRDGAGLTVNNEATPTHPDESTQYIELEFNSRENVDNFTSKWWTDLRNLVKADRRRFENIDKVLHTQNPGHASNAAIYGLFGLDCEHACRSEYHPVYALAVEIDDRPATNTWAIFVRNWGDEGFCGDLNHELYLEDDRIRLTLPRVGARPTLDIAASEFRSTRQEIPFPALAYDTQGRNVVLTFTMPEPRRRTNGEMILRLNWNGGFESIAPDIVRGVESTEFHSAQAEEGPEGYFERLAKDKPKLEETVVEPTRFRAATDRTAEVPKPTVSELPDFVPRPLGVTRPSARLVVDQEKKDANEQLWREACELYDGKLPPYRGRDVSEICAKLR